MSIVNLQGLRRTFFAPTVELQVDGRPSSTAFNDRLISLSVTHHNGKVSDQLTLQFDDRDTRGARSIQLPTIGVAISVTLGYEFYKREMGHFIVNQVNLSGSSGGRTISVSATPAPTLLYREATRTWSGKIVDVLNTIAARHNLKAKVSDTFKNTIIPASNQNQNGESDSAYVTGLAACNNAVFKLMAGNLLFMAKGEGTSATGKPMPVVNIPPHDIVQWSKTQTETQAQSKQQSISKVHAYWHDYSEAATKSCVAKSGGTASAGLANEIQLPHRYSNEADAKANAIAQLTELNREDASLDLTLIGHPDITAEGKISLSGVRDGVDGHYIVKSVTHSFSQGGYQSTIQAYVEPQTNAEIESS